RDGGRSGWQARTMSDPKGTGMGTALGVRSEVGVLRQVVLHRPGLELERLTPGNVHQLLFDDVLWAERAREEHDAFADLLRRCRTTFSSGTTSRGSTGRSRSTRWRCRRGGGRR